MRIGEWKSAGYVRIGNEMCRIWQYKDSNWSVTIPVSQTINTKTQSFLERLSVCLSESITQTPTN